LTARPVIGPAVRFAKRCVRRGLRWIREQPWHGQRIGMIRLGSRVDLFLPDDAEVLVARGDKVKAGRTAVARWKA